MSWWKIVLFLIVAVLVVYLGFAIVGFLFSILWYLILVGIVGLGGYAGYKYLTKNKQKELGGIDAVSQIELDNAKVVKELEEIKKKINR